MPQYKKSFIVLHHSLTARDTTTFEAVNNYHKNLWDFKSELGYYIGYHYFIAGDGRVYQGRADYEMGAHCYQDNKNEDSVGICLAGNFDHEEPSAAQLSSLKVLVKDLMAKYDIPSANLKFHRQYATYKSCPGNKIADDFFKKLLNQEKYMKLVQKTGTKEIWAIDKHNRRHNILNWSTFQCGTTMGLWDGKIEQVASLDAYPLGEIIILVTDN